MQTNQMESRSMAFTISGTHFTMNGKVKKVTLDILCLRDRIMVLFSPLFGFCVMCVASMKG